MTENISNDFATTLAGSIDNSTTTVNVTSATGSPSVNFRIRVDDELMLVTSKGSGTNWTVTRNIESTSAAAHADLAPLAHVVTKGGLDQYLSERYWPVGAVFISVVSTNPNTLLGFGTWSQIAAGRMLVGQNSGDTDFDTAEETGGAKTHTQTTAEMPVHTHTQDAHSHTHEHTHTQEQDTVRKITSGGVIGTATGSNLTTGGGTSGANGVTTSTTVATNQNTGSGNAMNIMNPYFVVYMWKRTA